MHWFHTYPTTMFNLTALKGTKFMTTEITSPFELVEVSGERYGDIITFGIRVKDDEDGTLDTIDLASASFQIDWTEGEYEYWGGFKNVNATPENDSSNDLSLGLTLNNAGEEGTRINFESFGFGSTTPITYSEGELVATFMLERIDQDPNHVQNSIALTKSNYSAADDLETPEDESEIDITTKPQVFLFDYDKDTVTINMATASGVEVPNATLHVSSDTVTDGLSLVAVEQIGGFVKYQLVLNVSDPMTTDANAIIDPDQSIDIFGAHIFTSSIIDITSREGGAGAASIAGATITALDVGVQTTDTATTDTTPTEPTTTPVGFAASAMEEDSADNIITHQDASQGYTGTEFFDQVDAAMLLADNGDMSGIEGIGVTDALHFDITGLTDLQGENLHGRYALAEFVAYTGTTGINFSHDGLPQSSNSSSTTVEPTTPVTPAAYTDTTSTNSYTSFHIRPEAVVGADASAQTFEVSDGSDVVLLGEGIYLNPGLNIDAISATDALGALKIAADATGRSQSQIIAADFDADGTVSAMDAYNILHYAVFGEGSNAEVPRWVYIDDIESSGATNSAVTYDDNIDLFIGNATTINATGVLRGDVSQNYTTIPENQNTLDQYLNQFISQMEAVSGVLLLNPPGSSTGSTGGSSGTAPTTEGGQIFGSEENDTIIGTPGDNLIYAYGGDDYVVTFEGNDVVHGGFGNDLIWSGGGNDLVIGDDGNDIIDPGDGDDFAIGGPGDDTIKLSAGNDFEDGGEGNDTLEIGSSSLSIPFSINLQTGRYFLTPLTIAETANFSSIENIKSFASVDLTIIDTIGTNVITLGSGDDTVTSAGGNDTISTGAGADTVTLGLGSYVVDLGGGDDTLHLGAQKSMIDGGSGTDILSVNASIGVNTLYVDLDKEFYFTEEIGQSFDGQDISLKDFESVTVIGSVTSSIIGNSSANIITGGSSNDTLIGNGGTDTLSGGDGQDTISGGLGVDILTGGAGEDKFVYNSSTDGADVITDFVIADDILNFTGAGDLSLAGYDQIQFVIGASDDFKNGANLISANHNTIVLTNAIESNTSAGIGATLAEINSGENAEIGDGVIVVAAEENGNTKIWYDAIVDDNNAVELATLENLTLQDLSNFTANNFLWAGNDFGPPVLLNYSISGYEFVSGDILYINYAASDYSGIELVEFTFTDELGHEFIVIDRHDDGIAEILLTETMPRGTYQLNSISLRDASGNFNETVIFVPADAVEFTLNGDAVEDTSAPELANLSVSFDYVESGTDILNVGDTLVVAYQFVDQTGLDFLEVTWVSENGFEITEGEGTSFMLGNDYVCGLEISSMFPKERYEAQKLNLIDPLGNSVDYFRDGLVTGASVLTAHEFDLSNLDFEIIA